MTRSGCTLLSRSSRPIVQCSMRFSFWERCDLQNPQYVFNMLYFTLYQLRQDTEMEEGDNEQRRHNIDDLLDLSTRCEPLLALSFQQSRRM